jgi:Tol biopolymer transport system component
MDMSDFFQSVGLIVLGSSLLLWSGVAKKSQDEKVKELFAARGIERVAYTFNHMNPSAGWFYEANEITKEHPSQKLLWESDAAEPSYTGDGTKVAFNLGRHGKSTGLYVMDVRTGLGSELREEVPATFVTHISWSHDGTSLAFAAGRDDKALVFVTRSDGVGLRAVAEGSWPSWSADDNQLVFERQTHSNGISTSVIWIANVDGSDAHPVTDNKNLSYDPSWIPNGRGILFSSNRDGKFAIYAMDANGRNVRPIMHSDKINLFAPSISPDGRTLVCDRSRGDLEFGNRSIWIIPLDGKGESMSLTSGYHASVVWQGEAKAVK